MDNAAVRIVPEDACMRKLMGVSFMLLAWMPLGHASLNAEPVSAVLNQQLTAACNLLTVQHVDWGNINAVVRRPAFACNARQGRSNTNAFPPQDRGLVQRTARAMSEKSP